MVLGTFDTLLLGGLFVQVYSSAVNAMPKPASKTGWYSFWYRFLRGLSAGFDTLFEQRFHMNMPINQESSKPRKRRKVEP